MAGKCRVSQDRATPADLAGVFEKLFEAGRQECVTGIDGILNIPQQMGKADLLLLGVTGLGGKAVGDPHFGLSPCKKARDDGLAPAPGNDVTDRTGVTEHPLPMGFTLHSRGRLVAGDDGSGAHVGFDQLAFGRERFGRARQHVGDGTFRQRQAEQSIKHFDQAVVTDKLAGVQIDHQRHNAGAER